MQQPLPLRPEDVPLRWDEAAAIVQTIADNVADARLEGVPPVEWLALDEEGALHVIPPAHATAAARARSSAASDLRDLLRKLVGPNPVPPELLAALETTKEGVPIDSAEAFSKAIAFFVRPSHQKGLPMVTARLRQDDEERRLQGGLEELMRKARSPEQPPQPGSHSPNPKKPEHASAARRHRRILVAAVVGAVVLPLLVGVGTLLMGSGESPGGSLIDQGRELLKEGRASARSLIGGSASAETTEPATPASSKDDDQRGPARTRARLEAPQAERPIGEVASVAWILSQPVANAAASTGTVESPRDTPEATALHRDALYDSEDDGVMPARLVHPRLPSQPRSDTPLHQFGRLELIVGTSGKVESVRLLSTTAERRYYDSMLLPAAKAWIFEPARRDGHPVRYRLTLILTN